MRKRVIVRYHLGMRTTAIAILLALALPACRPGPVDQDAPAPPGSPATAGADREAVSAEMSGEKPRRVVGFGPGEIELDHEAEFTGTASCDFCHADIVELAGSHHMALTGRRVTGQNRDVWFSGEAIDRPIEWPRTEGPPPRFRRDDTGVLLEAIDGDGAVRSARVDVIFGSGHRGFTPISVADGHGIRELRASFFADPGRWVMTPGSAGDPDPLGHVRSAESSSDCLRCHMTVIEWTEGGRLDLERSVFGVSCERCHGPGSAHERAVLEDEASPAIFNPGLLSPAAQTRFCGQCHRNPSTVEPHRVFLQTPDLARHAGVGLMLSACFRKSPPESAPSCLDCHDPHRNIRGVRREQNDSCLRCHADPGADHTSTAVALDADCISCHMPVEKRGFFGLSFTSHWIRVPGAPPPGETEERAEYAGLLEESYRAAIAPPGRGPERHGPERRSKLRMRLGKLLCMQGDPAEGLRWLREALTFEPLYKDRLLAAQYHLRAGETALAIDILDDAIRAAPENNRAYHDLARIHLAAGEPSRASEVLDRWEAARPGDPYLTEMRALVERARSAESAR